MRSAFFPYRQLNQAIRLCAIGAGIHLGGLFLTAEKAKQTCLMLSRKADGPCLPQFDPPWFGLPNQLV